MATGRQATLEADVGDEKAVESGAGGSAGASSGASAARAQPLIDLDFVRGLIEAVDASGIDSLEITRAGARVKISKTPPAPPAGPAMYAPPAMHMAPAPSSSPATAGSGAPSAGGSGGASGAGGSGSAGSGGAAAESEAAASRLTDVTSPMVGTFYRAPAPEAPPYVDVGTRVTKGQTLCILEAMKLMNELEAEVEGVVREILVDNAEPVEFGQVLFRIDPAG